MPEIRVLSRHLVNKIAAGEVIERPASVVKELVENALDAGAGSIDVTVEDGGRRLVAVRDDGAGMEADDLKLAFLPHATSKIATEEDLFNIRTMGFRGEALASIASVARASILTRRRGSADPSGYEVRAEGGEISEVRPAAAPDGTTVTVRDLFYSTPARRKFLRTAQTEFGHVVEQLARLALPHSGVAFTLTHNGRVTHRLPAAQSVRRRAGDFFGEDLAETLIELSDRDATVRVGGLIAPPAAARASARWQYFFVNGRYVRDRFLGHALREAFRGAMDPSRSPVAVIFIELPPEEVDVNVHPAKIEVRFRDGRLVHSQLLAAIRDALNRSNLSPTIRLDSPSMAPAGRRGLASDDSAPSQARAAPDEPPDDERRQGLKQALADFFKRQTPPQRRLDFPARPAGTFQPANPRLPAGAIGAPPASGNLDSPPRERGVLADSTDGETSAPPEFGTFIAEPRVSPPRPGVRAALPAMQVHDSYIVAATAEGLVIVDQHALHERIIYEDLTRRLAEGPLAAQRLLIPPTLSVTESEKARLLERAALLDRLGVEVADFGPRAVAVQKFPALLAGRGVPVEEFVRDLLDLMAEHATDEPEGLLQELLATMACKAAVKAGDPLSDEEIQALLARHEEVRRGGSCPHGRPTTLTLTLTELEKQFKRT